MRYWAIFCAVGFAACPSAPNLTTCGDGVIDAAEQCDDNNTASNDGCSSACQTELCGDGIAQSALSEQCDDANTIDTDECTNSCQSARCGDNILGPGEQCEDGANINGDGCSAQCQDEFCGDGQTNNNTEECDDGGNVDGDGCSAACLIEASSGQLQTFLVDSINIPADDAEAAAFGFDYNGDGIVDDQDNSLSDLSDALSNAGFNIQTAVNGATNSGTLLYAFDVTADSFVNDSTALVLGYLASVVGGFAPSFDGFDVVSALAQESLLQNGVIANSVLSAGPSDFFFGLPLDTGSLTILPMERSLVEASIDANGLFNGKLTGTVSAIEFAPITEDIAALLNEAVLLEAQAFANGAPISCQDDAPCAVDGGACTDRNGDAITTGVCLDPNAPIFALFFLGDKDQDGIIEVDFDPGSGTFPQNEVELFFNISSSGAEPTGIIGNLFRLDLDQNGLNDAIGLGVGFTAVHAIHQ
jgi:cysteine-rich repeat protein